MVNSNVSMYSIMVFVLQYYQMKLTCIILLYIDIQYQFCCACECSFTSKEHCSSSLYFLSGTEWFLCDEKCNCINVVVNFLRSAIPSPHGCCSPFYFSSYVFNRDFLDGLLDVV